MSKSKFHLPVYTQNFPPGGGGGGGGVYILSGTTQTKTKIAIWMEV